MPDDFRELIKYIKSLDGYKLPEYKDLPQIPLYMEQVVSYVNETLNNIYKNNENGITPFMVNNYVKAKMINAPKKKKYDTNHIGYLLSIGLLKNVVSMRDLAGIIEIDKTFTDNKEQLYDVFKEMHDEVLKNQAHRVKARLDAIDRGKNKYKKNKDLEDRLNLTYVALRLYIESETSKLIADAIMNKLSKMVLPKEVFKESKKEVKYQNKKLGKEASKIGSSRKIK